METAPVVPLPALQRAPGDAATDAGAAAAAEPTRTGLAAHLPASSVFARPDFQNTFAAFRARLQGPPRE